MARHAKLVIAALVATLAATLGTAGAVASSDAGKPVHTKPMYKDANWCC